jgi:hypothetical protein
MAETVHHNEHIVSHKNVLEIIKYRNEIQRD